MSNDTILRYIAEMQAKFMLDRYDKETVAMVEKCFSQPIETLSEFEFMFIVAHAKHMRRFYESLIIINNSNRDVVKECTELLAAIKEVENVSKELVKVH